MSRILVVDDVAPVRLVVRVACEQAGHEVHEAIDAATGIEAYGRVQPHLLVLDLGMPGGGGPFVLKSLRRDGERRICPVLVVTGNLDQTPDAIRDELAVDRVLRKPFRISELMVHVVQLLALGGRAAAPPPRA